MLPSNLDRLGTSCRRSPAVLPCRFRRGNAFALTFQHQLALELSDGAKHIEHEPSGRRRGVDCLIEDFDRDALCIELLTNGNEMSNTPGKPVELGDNKRVPSRAYSSAASNSALCATDETFSAKIFSQPEAFSVLI